MKLFIEIKRDPARRTGISVVEVLSAMVVALIGVFGVMVLIPFSVQQAQSGLDRNESATVGRNALEQLEIEGFRFVDSQDNTRIGQASNVGGSISCRNLLNDPPRVLVVDPLFVADRGASSTPGTRYQNFVGFDRFTLADSLNQEMSVAMARQMCRTTDDLQFQSAVDELGPPQQIFDQANGTSVRRQSDGRMSWNAVLVPVGASASNAGLRFRMNILVHKDRDLLDGVQYEPRQAVLLGGGTVQLNSPLTDVRRDDWVMLRNTQAGGNSGYQSQHQQVGFYRVTAVGGTNSIGANSILTLDGPDWDPGNGPANLYHLVGIRDGKRSGQVINVYERTMQWERKSNWN